jgi:hypothetical protein
MINHQRKAFIESITNKQKIDKKIISTKTVISAETNI